MSAKTMAASSGKRRIGCMVASAAISGFRQKRMKSLARDLSSRYSGRYRPAWRISQIGGLGSTSPARALKRSGLGGSVMASS